MAEEAPVVLRIGAALESSVEKSFAQLEARANKAAKQLEKSADVGAKAAETAATRAATRQLRAAEQAAAASQRLAEKAASAQINATERVTRAREAGAARAARAEERANRSLGTRFARSTANSATRFLAPYAPLASMARRTGSEIMRGLGVDLNISGAVARNVGRETLATSLSNSGFQENNKGPNGQRVAAGTLLREAKDVGANTSMDPTAILEAGRAFVGVTGNLDQARQSMSGLAKISKATSADIVDVSKAAAKVNAQLEESPTKAEDTLAVVRLLAGQGKLGAAEMSDFARSIGQIAGTAHRFKGDTTNNIAELSAMAQLSVQRGFSKGPAQSATGVASFANVFSNTANVKKFGKLGISEAFLQNASPEEIIKRSLLATKGSNLGMGTLFKNTRARALTLPFEQAFNAASGGKTDQASLARGIEAVNVEFDRLKKGAMSSGEVDKEFAAQMETTASKAQRFQNKLDDVVEHIQARLLPVLEKLEDPAIRLAKALGDLVTSAVDHPWTAVSAAIGLAIGRAGIESTLRAGIERILLGAGGANAAGVGGAVGAAGAVLTIAALAVTTLVVGKAIIDYFATKDDQNQRDTGEGLAHAEEFANKAEAKLRVGDRAGAQAAAEEAKAQAEKGLKGVGEPQDTGKYLDIIRTASAVLGIGGIEKIFDKKIESAVNSRVNAETESRNQLVGALQRAENLLSTIAANTGSLGPTLGPAGAAVGTGSQL